MKNITALFISLLAVGPSGFGQGFINLDFESANIPSGSGGGYVAASDAIPGWVAYKEGVAVDPIVYNALSLGVPEISIHDSSDPYGYYFGGVIAGNYTVVLQPSFPGGIRSAAIGQTGLIPADAQSLILYANGPISVSFAAQFVPLDILGSGSNYTIYGGNIGAYAGQSGELRFTANAISPSGWGTALDNIQFSAAAIPEPSAVSLLGLGLLALGWHRWRAERS